MPLNMEERRKYTPLPFDHFFFCFLPAEAAAGACALVREADGFMLDWNVANHDCRSFAWLIALCLRCGANAMCVRPSEATPKVDLAPRGSRCVLAFLAQLYVLPACETRLSSGHELRKG